MFILGRDPDAEEAEPDRDPREHPGHLPAKCHQPGMAEYSSRTSVEKAEISTFF